MNLRVEASIGHIVKVITYPLKSYASVLEELRDFAIGEMRRIEEAEDAEDERDS